MRKKTLMSSTAIPSCLRYLNAKDVFKSCSLYDYWCLKSHSSVKLVFSYGWRVESCIRGSPRCLPVYIDFDVIYFIDILLIVFKYSQNGKVSFDTSTTTIPCVLWIRIV